MKITKIYESTSTSGYYSDGDGNFFTDKEDAKTLSKIKYENNSSEPIEHNVIEEDGQYFILGRCVPVTLSLEKKMDINELELKKLQDNEKLYVEIPESGIVRDPDNSISVYHKEDYSLSMNEAVGVANDMRDKKIVSLNKSLEKMRSLIF